MIQIFGFRPVGAGPEPLNRKVIPVRQSKLDCQSVQDLFLHIKDHLGAIDKIEHYNLHFTVHDCFNQADRDFSHQTILPIDIDHVNIAHKKDVIKCVLSTLNLKFNKTGILWSGHGLQMFVEQDTQITDNTYFNNNRQFYKLICQKVNAQLKKLNLSGEMDPAVFSIKRMMRVPQTINKKKGMDPTPCTLIQPIIEPQIRDILDLIGVTIKVNKNDTIALNSARAMFKTGGVDEAGILKECEFIKYCKENQHKVSEPQWYAMLGILGHFKNKELVHDYSNKHPDYIREDTQIKTKQAIESAGPRTCINISSLSNACEGCKHNGIIRSPIKIESDTYMKTKSTGFRETIAVKDSSGNVIDYKIGKVANEDLLKFLVYKKGLINNPETESMPIFWDGKKWTDVTKKFLEGFCERNVKPAPNSHEVTEFVRKIFRINYVDEDLNKLMERKINLSNGVYDINTGERLKHDKKFLFKYCLNYDYVPDAKAPLFDKFLDDITCNDGELKQCLLEFGGYALSGDKYIFHKALILIGEGANGKSTFMDVIRFLLEDEDGPQSMAISCVPIAGLEDKNERYDLLSALINLAEETNQYAFARSEQFKTLTAGGEVTAKKLYHDTIRKKNKCKFIFAANHMPKSSDSSVGMKRRTLFIPFDREFTEEDMDKQLIQKLKLERSGILNMFISAYKKVISMDRPQLIEPERSKQMLREFVDENDTSLFEEFVDDVVEISDDHKDRTTVKEICRAYDKYFRDMQGKEFRAKLTKKQVIWRFAKFAEEKGFEKYRSRDGIGYENINLKISRSSY